MKKQNLTSDVIECKICRKSSRFVEIGTVSDMKDDECDDGPPLNSGDVFDILRCGHCKKETIRKYFWVDGWEDEDREPNYDYLYPPAQLQKRYKNLPEKVEASLKSAQAVKDIEANAYGVLLRRTLEVICIEQGASGRSLHEQLQDLSAKNVIPATLASIANELKNLGNIGAHAGSGELSSDEAELMTLLCDAIVEYVYSAPTLVNLAKNRLDKIKKGNIK